MPNPRLIELAKRHMSPEPPKPKAQKARLEHELTLPQTYSFLEGDLGEKVHKEIVNKYGADHSLVTSDIDYTDGIVKGSKPGYVIAVNEVLKKQKIRTANSADIGKIIEEEHLKLTDFYEDLGLVLYSQSEPNEYLAKDLAKQIKRRTTLKFPTLLSLAGLSLKEDNQAPERLAFKLTNQNKIIHAPQLLNENNRGKFTELDEDGLPILDQNGKYTLYTGNSGLTVLYRSGDLDLYAWGEDLAYSDSDGRVVLCAEGTRAKK